MADIDQALVLRMAECLRKVAGHLNNDHDPRTVNISRIKETCLEAEDIVAELPEPVDADFVEAGNAMGEWLLPADPQTQQVIAWAIRRGRELQKEESR